MRHFQERGNGTARLRRAELFDYLYFFLFSTAKSLCASSPCGYRRRASDYYGSQRLEFIAFSKGGLSTQLHFRKSLFRLTQGLRLDGVSPVLRCNFRQYSRRSNRLYNSKLTSSEFPVGVPAPIAKTRIATSATTSQCYGSENIHYSRLQSCEIR